jgi:hypothetical protein
MPTVTPEARSGFVDHLPSSVWKWSFKGIEAFFDAQQLAALRKTLALDPRPHYHQDDKRSMACLSAATTSFPVTTQGVLRVLPLS